VGRYHPAALGTDHYPAGRPGGRSQSIEV